MNELKKEFTNEEKIEFFKDELKFIKRDDVRELAMDLLRNTQDYFFYVPASSTGKYHPLYTTGLHGLMLHTKALMCILNDLTSLEHCSFTDDEKDLLFVAGLIHDTVKLGNDPDGYTVSNHPVLAANRVREYIGSGIIEDYELQYIADAVESHMGEWNTDKYSSIVLPKPVTAAQKIIHECDYLASRKHIEFTFKGFEKSYKIKVKKNKTKEKKAVSDKKNVNKNKPANNRSLCVEDFIAGKTIDDIAKERGLKDTTVEGYIIYAAVENDKIDIDFFINSKYEKEILNIINDESWNGRLIPIKEALPEEVTYSCIRAVIAKYKRNNNKKEG